MNKDLDEAKGSKHLDIQSKCSNSVVSVSKV